MSNIKTVLENVATSLPQNLKETEFPTGIQRIDEKLWFGRKEVVIIGARSSHCKTTFSFNNLAINCANLGKQTFYFTLEDSKEKLCIRYMAKQLSIDSNDIRRNNLTAEQMEQIATFVDNFSELPLHIFESGFDIRQMEQRIAESKKIPDIIILDYINKIGTRGKPRYEEITEYSNQLTDIAKKYNCLCVLVCQVNREAQGEGNTTRIHPPQLHHLRDSGNLEQIANSVIFLHYPYKYVDDPMKIKTDENDKNSIFICIAKNKDGDTGKLRCGFIPEYNKIF